MTAFLSVIAVIALLASLGTCALAKGAPHEIEAQVWFLIFVVAAAGATVIDVLRAISKRLEEQRDGASKPKTE